MKTYTLRYARVVILERTIEVPDDAEDPEEEAWRIAGELEDNGDLSIGDYVTHPDLVEIEDHDEIWEITED